MFHCIALRDLLPQVIDKKETFKILVSTSIATGAMIIACKVVKIDNYFFECVYSVCVFCFCYILFGLLLKIKTEKDLLKVVVNKIKVYRN